MWDGRTKSLVRLAFERSGRSYAADTFWSVNRLFEDYLTRWSGIYTEACEATNVRGEQSPEILDLRMACLRDADQVRLRPSESAPITARCWPQSWAGIISASIILIACCGPAASPRWTCSRCKDSGLQDAPDAVLLPGSDDEVAEILRYCSQHGIAVVPFGGGTSVVGGLDPIRGDFAAAVSLDLRRFDQLLDFDEVSGEAEFGAGVTGPRAEELLGAQGFSLGHFPQSFEFASIGGFAATRSSGQDSAGYGRFDDMIRGLRVITPAGVLDLGRGRGQRPARICGNWSSARRVCSASSPGCG